MARGQRKVGADKSPTIMELPLACSDETAAVEFLERKRWGDSPACPRCGDLDIYQMTDRKTGERNARYLSRCRGCKRQFTVRIGTIFEDSRIPLRFWCYAFWKACSSKKGVSALQIKRETGLSYKSALFLMHRIRWAMRDDDETPLTGTVEVDETFVGGKPRYSANHPKRKAWSTKVPVLVMLERGGKARTRVPERVTATALTKALLANVSREARLITDEASAYWKVGERFKGGHETTIHSQREYVRGDVHSNTAESFFSLLKRGVYGTFHSVSKHHLHRYADEFTFRWNTRHLDDGARIMQAIRASEGKRLRYREPTAKTE